MSCKSCNLVAGWKLSDLFMVFDTIENITKYNEDTGQPFKKEIRCENLYFLGKKVDVTSGYPEEWIKELGLGLTIFSCGDGNRAYGKEGLRSFNLNKFVVGKNIVSVDEDNWIDEVPENKALDEVKETMNELCNKFGVKFELSPKLLMVLYYSY